MVNQHTVEQRCGDESGDKAGEEEDTADQAGSHIRIPVWSLFFKKKKKTSVEWRMLRVKGLRKRTNI